jgi:uncharacterized Ntn-hydrolase superfamily protein
MTFSISAVCPRTGTMGIAISSSSPAVAARCSHARACAGVVASQNITDPSLGPKALDLLESGIGADKALEILLSDYPTKAWRQVVVVDRTGQSATFSGEETLGINATAKGPYCAAAGNLLANDTVPAAMVASFSDTKGDLGDRLIAAMKAGLAAGGEAGPVHSAGLYMVRNVSWPVADLRVDWAEDDPIGALSNLWDLYKPQLEDYVTRAIDPTAAPSYGVPGDE